ncbi:MAG: hypothetical protein PHV68_10260 [Candidatus Gastranaerophilales bacterium]|nr:hypothetical protein [Candidatus Gastranaerophilales bacterium]
MKKRISVFCFATIISLNANSSAFSYAENGFCSGIDGVKVCVMEEVMADILKQTLYEVGTKVLQKVTDKTINTTNYQTYDENNSNSNSQTTSYETYNESTQVVNENSSSTSSEAQEELIPL